jgi:hypothetical protein
MVAGLHRWLGTVSACERALGLNLWWVCSQSTTSMVNAEFSP